MAKNAKGICVAICFGSSNNLTGLNVIHWKYSIQRLKIADSVFIETVPEK